MSTTVVYASGESGIVRATSLNNYLESARGDGSFGVFTTQATAYAGQLVSSWFIYQAFLTWDTSAVGTDTVSNVDFEVDGVADNSTSDLVVESYAYDWGATLTSADFRDSDVDIPALGSIIASHDTASGWTLTAGYNQTMGALTAFDSAINGAGDTLIVLISSRHRTETVPSGLTEYVTFQCTGNTNDARLTITHAAATNIYTAIDDDPDSPDGVIIRTTVS
ncbi:MAG TPA: hypothetical protein VMW94_10065 [Actinomycetes bacterium]|nr:hypothetical protein [Actinomycetes bacterium]